MESKRRDKGARGPLMTVRDVLELPSMTGASVLVGADVLDRNVTNIMVLEGPDVEKWGRPGLLLLTSFYALEPLSPDERVEFFRKAAGAGVTGFVFKPGRLVGEVPEDYLLACERCSLPIVRTSPDHGVAYDIAGAGTADCTSMHDAIYMALDVFRNRRWYAEITANPLRRYERERGADVSVKDLKLPDAQEE